MKRLVNKIYAWYLALKLDAMAQDVERLQRRNLKLDAQIRRALGQ